MHFLSYSVAGTVIVHTVIEKRMDFSVTSLFTVWVYVYFSSYSVRGFKDISIKDGTLFHFVD